MNNETQKNSLSDEILNKIKSGSVKMKPKLYFILQTIFLILSIFTLFLFVIYIVSFIAFSLRATGLLFLPKFGFPGIGIFLISFPWPLILLAIILIAALEILSKHFNFIYRRPLLYSLIGIIIIVIAIGFLVERTPFHSNLFRRSQTEHLPAIEPFYRDFGVPRIPDAHIGVISEIIDGNFVIKTPRDETLTIIITPETNFSPEKDIKEGDTIVVLGKRNDDTVQALEVHEIGKDSNLFPPPRFENGHIPPLR